MTKQNSFLRELGYPVEHPQVGDESLYGVVWVAGQAQKRAQKALKPFGLTPVKFNYLMVVKHIGGPEGLSQREIATRLLMDAGYVARYLDDLERRGWVIRTPGPDRRSNRIKITKKGDQLLNQVWPIYKATVRALTGGLSDAENHRLIELLCQWRDFLRA